MSKENKSPFTASRITLEIPDNTNLCEDMIKVSAVLRAVLHDLSDRRRTEDLPDVEQEMINYAGAIVMQVVSNICLNLEPNQQYVFLEFCGFSEDLVEKILPEIRVTEKILRE